MPKDEDRIIDGFADRKDDQDIVALAERLAGGKADEEASRLARAAMIGSCGAG